jgi:transcriptional regulator with XRE-family HTH domain
MSDINLIDKHVGGRLRALREARGISPEALVRACNLSIDRLDRLENGRERITVDDMRRLCEVLGVAPADFFRGLYDRDDKSGPVGGDLSIEEEGRLLMTDFRRIADPGKRRTLMALASAFAQESKNGSEG